MTKCKCLACTCESHCNHSCNKCEGCPDCECDECNPILPGGENWPYKSGDD